MVNIEGNGQEIKQEQMMQGQKRRKRLITLVKDSYTAEEE
jgi:hypothetical protein